MTAPVFACPEVAVFWRYISSSLERLVLLGESLDAEALRWRPPAPRTNSVVALVAHTPGNAEENILETLCGGQVGRRREDEFAPPRVSAEELRERWLELRARLERAVTGLSAAALDGQVNHPRRGVLTGREVLIVVARHAAEHLGQAELTRDLWLASGE